jgi:hypothetical protein
MVPAHALTKISSKHRERNDAIYATGTYSYREIAAYYGGHLVDYLWTNVIT